MKINAEFEKFDKVIWTSGYVPTNPAGCKEAAALLKTRLAALSRPGKDERCFRVA
jgi:hypothetical protein